jgi:uncharacterized protein YecE (DUF72 family)
MSDKSLAARVRIGCQGWNYDDWISGPAAGAGVFYPQGTRAPQMLEIYARAFNTVEVDSSFYAIPSAAAIDNWIRRTPPGFTFSLKMPRQITHEQGLAGASASLVADFCARARQFGERLGVILIQLPPQFDATAENARRLRAFGANLPRDLRFSVEFRHPDWMHERVVDELAPHGMALALIDGPWVPRASMWRLAERQTAKFAYVRWMGRRDLMRFDQIQRPQDENLRAWSGTVRRLSERGEVYAYFSNFYEGHAPASANKLKRLLGQRVVGPTDLVDQPSLF